MRGKCFLLFKIQLRNEMIRMLHRKGSKALAVVIAFVGLLFAFNFYGLADTLGSQGLWEALPSLGLGTACMIILFFTMLKTNGVLFAYGEYDILMSLPVKTSTVIASRFLTMYVMNLILSAIVMIPMGLGYAKWCQPGAAFYLEWLFGIVAAPLIPTVLAALLGMGIILISSRFKHTKPISAVLTMAGTLVIAAASFSFGRVGGGFNGASLQSLGEMSMKQINNFYAPAALFYNGIVKRDGFQFLLFFAGSFAGYYFFLGLISLVYKKLNTALTTYHAKSDYRVTEITSSSSIKALYKKEWKRFISSPAYCANMGMGCLMTIVGSAGCFFVSREKLNLILQSMDAVAGDATRFLPLIVGTLLSMTCTTCVSLSLEGKNAWILKSIPVDEATIYRSKMLFNLTLQLPCALLAALLLNLRFPLAFSTRILLFPVPLAFSVLSTVWGLFLNLKLLDYEWTSETSLIKRSPASIAGIFFGMVTGIAAIAIGSPLHHAAYVGYEAAVVVLALGGAWGLWRYAKKLKL